MTTERVREKESQRKRERKSERKIILKIYDKGKCYICFRKIFYESKG